MPSSSATMSLKSWSSFGQRWFTHMRERLHTGGLKREAVSLEAIWTEGLAVKCLQSLLEDLEGLQPPDLASEAL